MFVFLLKHFFYSEVAYTFSYVLPI